MQDFLDQSFLMLYSFRTPFTLTELHLINERQGVLGLKSLPSYVQAHPRIGKYLKHLASARESFGSDRFQEEGQRDAVTTHYALILTALALVSETIANGRTDTVIPRVEVFPNLGLSRRREIMSHLFTLQISKGCNWPCNICALDSLPVAHSTPFPFVQALLSSTIEDNNCEGNKDRGMLPYFDSESWDYYCARFGADFSDVVELASASPLFYLTSLTTALWPSNAQVPQTAAERILSLHKAGGYFSPTQDQIRIPAPDGFGNVIFTSSIRISFGPMKPGSPQTYVRSVVRAANALAELNPHVFLRYTAANLGEAYRLRDAVHDRLDQPQSFVWVNAEQEYLGGSVIPLGRASSLYRDPIDKSQIPKRNSGVEGYFINPDGTISYYRTKYGCFHDQSIEPTGYRAFNLEDLPPDEKG